MLLLVLCAFQCNQDEQQYRVGYSTVFRIYNLSGEDVSIKWDGIEEDRNCHRLILKDQEWELQISDEDAERWRKTDWRDPK